MEKFVKIPTFDEILKKYGNEIYDTDHYNNYEYEYCNNEKTDCIINCEDNQQCLEYCRVKYEDCVKYGSEESKEEYKKRLKEDYNTQTDIIKETVDTKKIYREMNINDPELFINELTKYGKTSFQCNKKKCEATENREGLGIYWTPYKLMANSYWGTNGYPVILSGEIQNDKSINIDNTLIAEMIHQSNEAEVQLYENQEIKIFEIEYIDPATKITKKIFGNWKVYT